MQLLTHYPKEDMRAARLYYNTEQLIAFWKYYHALIDNSISKGLISKRLPLLSATSDPANRQITLKAIKTSQLEGGLFIQLTQTPRPTFEKKELDDMHAIQGGALNKKDVLDSLHGRLSQVMQLAYKACPILYSLFLAQERQSDSKIWEAYKIHTFLDTFMYLSSKTGPRTSRFELIFFANNLRELVVFLTAALASGKHLSIRQTTEFLDNQTKYYLGLSQRITLEENEILNTHKEFLHYDETRNIVRLENIPTQTLESSSILFQDLSITSLGCPFGRTKGVKQNAITEIYEFFNQLLIRALEASWEFEYLYKK